MLYSHLQTEAVSSSGDNQHYSSEYGVSGAHSLDEGGGGGGGKYHLP